MKDFILPYIDYEYSNPLTFENNNNNKIEEPIMKSIKTNSIKKVFHYDSSIKFKITDEQIADLLDQLPFEYIEEYDKWSIITNILKGLDKKDLWNKWSYQSDRYNHTKNNTIWRNIKKIKFDINYIVNVINLNLNKNDKIKLIDSYKEFHPITKNIIVNKFNNEYVSNIYTYNDFKNNNTAIIQSCTGTGKTTMVAKHLSKYLTKDKNKHIKLLSIIDKKALGHQH